MDWELPNELGLLPDHEKNEWVQVPSLLEIVARIETLEAAEKKRGDREAKALQILTERAERKQ